MSECGAVNYSKHWLCFSSVLTSLTLFAEVYILSSVVDCLLLLSGVTFPLTFHSACHSTAAPIFSANTNKLFNLIIWHRLSCVPILWKHPASQPSIMASSSTKEPRRMLPLSPPRRNTNLTDLQSNMLPDAVFNTPSRLRSPKRSPYTSITPYRSPKRAPQSNQKIHDCAVDFDETFRTPLPNAKCLENEITPSSKRHTKGLVPFDEDVIAQTPSREDNDKWLENFGIDISLLKMVDEEFAPLLKQRDEQNDENMNPNHMLDGRLSPGRTPAKTTIGSPYYMRKFPGFSIPKSDEKSPGSSNVMKASLSPHNTELDPCPLSLMRPHTPSITPSRNSLPRTPPPRKTPSRNSNGEAQMVNFAHARLAAAKQPSRIPRAPRSGQASQTSPSAKTGAFAFLSREEMKKEDAIKDEKPLVSILKVESRTPRRIATLEDNTPERARSVRRHRRSSVRISTRELRAIQEAQDRDESDEEKLPRPQKRTSITINQNLGVEVGIQGGSSIVYTPVRATRKQRELLGADTVVTPVRRSLRLSRRSLEGEIPAVGIAKKKDLDKTERTRLLESSDYAYVPNNNLL